MNSKKELERIGNIKYCDNKGIVCEIKYSEETMKSYNIIKKDLEVLDILKKHLSVRCIGESYLYDVVCNLGEKEVLNNDDYEKENEEFLKVKEWLKNDK